VRKSTRNYSGEGHRFVGATIKATLLGPADIEQVLGARFPAHVASTRMSRSARAPYCRNSGCPMLADPAITTPHGPRFPSCGNRLHGRTLALWRRDASGLAARPTFSLMARAQRETWSLNA